MNIKIFVLALLMLVIISCKVGAQTVIYGNVGVENVNISVRNSTVGTSSDANGDYTLRLSGLSGAMQLHYSCIGYVDTIVSLSSRQMLHDSIRISFVMRKQNYSLEEVGILAKRNTRFEGDRHFIMDFEIYDGVIGILETNHNRQRFRIILADEDLIGFDTIIISSGITPTGLLRDCLGNCQMTTADSVYEINLAKPHKVIAVSRKEYNKVMLGCQFVTDQHIDLTPEQVTSIKAIGEWEFLAIANEELVDTVRKRLLKDDHLARIYYGTLRLGINMHQVKPGWIAPSGDSIEVTLPKIGLLDRDFIDEARTKSFFESGSWSHEDREKLYHQAYQKMLNHCLTPENLQQARQNGEEQFRNMMKTLGYEHILIRWEE